MSDPAGLPSTLGIEAVEWVADDPSGLTVRITGRWRRRRPDWQGPAILVIEAEGRRHRIPAMPEPPFLIGLLPGMWRMSFAIPAELAHSLEARRTWLALGAVMVPINLIHPGVEAAETEPAVPGEAHPPVDPQLLAARELRTLEVTAQSARRRAQEADERARHLQEKIEDLRLELARTRAEPERLRSIIEVRERDLRRARQDLHAETERRSEIEEQLAEQERTVERLRARVRTLVARGEELEHDLRRLRRAVDEAQGQAAVARAALASADRSVQPAVKLDGEFALVGREFPARARESPVLAIPARELELERALSAARLRVSRPEPGAVEAEQAAVQLEAIEAALSREREARQAAEARAQAAETRAQAAETRAQAAEASAQTAETSSRAAHARAQLAEESAWAAQERVEAAEGRVKALEQDLDRQRERSRRALSAIEGFRCELQALRLSEPQQRPAIAAPDVMPVVPAPPRPEPIDSPFEADRLSAALARLREERPVESEPPAGEPPAEPSAPVQPSRPEAAGAPTATTDALPRLFRALVAEDPSAAGRLVLALLPAQRRVHPRPVAYDLVLGPTACVRVTTGSDAPAIELTTSARPHNEIQFRVDGDPAAVARLLAAGRLRARLSRSVARLEGDRAALAALRALVTTPLSLDDLIDAGVTLDPGLALALVAEQVGAGLPEAFSIAHRTSQEAPPAAVLQAVPGQRPAVIDAPLELPATTTIVCPAPDLLSVLAGRDAPGASIRGEARPLALIRRAVQRA